MLCAFTNNYSKVIRHIRPSKNSLLYGFSILYYLMVITKYCTSFQAHFGVPIKLEWPTTRWQPHPLSLKATPTKHAYKLQCRRVWLVWPSFFSFRCYLPTYLPYAATGSPKKQLNIGMGLQLTISSSKSISLQGPNTGGSSARHKYIMNGTHYMYEGSWSS